MKILEIEWKHLDVSGETCDRCYDTGKNLIQEIKRLNKALNPKGIAVIIIETKLDDSQISQSNIILFNGVPIEEILDITISDNYCSSCSTLLESKTYCRTVTYDSNQYEDIPVKAIRHAAYTVLGIEYIKTEELSLCKQQGNPK
ncbi:MAG: DUF2703 domain-containing protein [Proteocatella sp.]